ncbi:MAG: glycolate oxidase subunit GlcF [Methylocystis sp.]
MQTHFSLVALADPDMARSEKILRACVHCGFCTATCPTFLLTGDELDSPRGRIYLIKEMLENERPADARTTRHVDRCLSCLSCMTTCPSSVHYMHLVDHARAHIEQTFSRPLGERFLRGALAFVLARPALFRLALRGATLARPFAKVLPGRLRGLVAMAPKHLPAPSTVDRPQVFAAQGQRKMRVALLNGCAQTVLDTRINEATIRLLTRHGVEVVVTRGAGCCGALAHHLGKTGESRAFAARNIEAWSCEIEAGGLDAVVTNTSGCGVTVKDYGFMFQDDPRLAERAAHISAIARDVSEIVAAMDFRPTGTTPPLRVAYHAACSLQHGQRITREPLDLLKAAGFVPMPVPEGHICCGSAGTYNLLQLEMAGELRSRKAANIESLSPDVIAAGNLGCMIQIGGGTEIPVAHLVELLDWASGGLYPQGLESE